MTIPLTGALILLLGGVLFLFSPKLLYAALIVSIPFSATAVVNFGSGDAARGIAAWLFLGALWILRESLSGAPPWNRSGWHATRRARYGLLAFLGAVFVSMCVPLVLNGTQWVHSLNPITLRTVTTPLRLGVNNQARTLAFGIFLAIFVAAENCNSSKLFYSLKLYVGSCVFTAFWGLVQFWCNLTGHAYPAYIFNNSTSLTAIGYRETFAPLGLNLHRVSSVAFEPSVFAEELLIALAVLLICRGLERTLISRKWDSVGGALIIAGLLVSTSATAYAGIVVVLLVTGVVLFRAGKPSKPYFASVVGIIVAGGVMAALVPLFSQLASIELVNKLQGASGAARLESVFLAAHDFFKYPILGVGWQSVYSSDLVFLILANTGLVGFLTFLSFLWPVFRGLWSLSGTAFPAGIVLFGALVVTLVLSQAAMFEFLAGYDWVFFGLGAGALAAQRIDRSPVVDRRSKVSPNSASTPQAESA